MNQKPMRTYDEVIVAIADTLDAHDRAVIMIEWLSENCVEQEREMEFYRYPYSSQHRQAHESMHNLAKLGVTHVQQMSMLRDHHNIWDRQYQDWLDQKESGFGHDL